MGGTPEDQELDAEYVASFEIAGPRNNLPGAFREA